MTRVLAVSAIVLAAAGCAAAACSLGLSTADYADGADGAPEAAAPEGDGGVSATPDGSSPVAVPDGGGDAGADATPTTDGIVGLWHLDEGSGTSIHDDGPGHYDGAINGNVTWIPGRSGGSALQFDGVATSYVLISHADALEQNETFTVALWAKVDTSDHVNPTMFSAGYVFYLRINSLSPQIELGTDSGNADYDLQRPSTWHHFAITYDSGAVAWYVDGAKQVLSIDEFTPGTTKERDQSPIYIGRSQGPEDDNAWPGALDEIRYYDRPLSDAEIAVLAQ